MTIDISSSHFVRSIVSKIHIWCWYKCWVLIFACVDIFDNWCVCLFWSLPISSVALDQEKQSLLFQCYVYDWRCFLEYHNYCFALSFQMTIDISSTLFEVSFRKYISGAGTSVGC
jgi:hypothetical protein